MAKRPVINQPYPINFEEITFVVTAQCMSSVFLTESYQSVFIGSLLFCIAAGTLQSLCQNKKFNKKNIQRIQGFISNFGNTFTSYAGLVYVSCVHFRNIKHDYALLDCYRLFLFASICCFFSFQISLTVTDRTLNINNSYDSFKYSKPWIVNWRYITYVCYGIIGLSYIHSISNWNLIVFTNGLFASILSYYAAFWLSHSLEFVCYITNTVACILVFMMFILNHSKYVFPSNDLANQFEVFILTFSGCFSQFVSTITYPNMFYTQFEQNKAIRFVIINQVIAAVFIALFHLFV
eukprot:55800_1